MQEFLANNTVSCNLMSLTGYRTLVILDALMKTPLSNDEINECLFNDQYIREKFSNDTLRLYINSLREIGCEIIGANKSNNKKYELVSHPFSYKIPPSQISAIAKLYKSIQDKIDIKQIIELEVFFNKVADLSKSTEVKDAFSSFSLLKGINKDVLNDLLVYCRNKNQIVFLYNSPRSGEKEIEVIADKISLKSGKLYFWGSNLTHGQYSYFALDRILNIQSIKLIKANETFPSVKVVYDVYDKDYIFSSFENVLEQHADRFVIEADSENEFSLIQKILFMAEDCKVLQPQEFKKKLVLKLQSMEKLYEDN